MYLKLITFRPQDKSFQDKIFSYRFSPQTSIRNFVYYVSLHFLKYSLHLTQNVRFSSQQISVQILALLSTSHWTIYLMHFSLNLLICGTEIRSPLNISNVKGKKIQMRPICQLSKFLKLSNKLCPHLIYFSLSFSHPSCLLLWNLLITLRPESHIALNGPVPTTCKLEQNTDLGAGHGKSNPGLLNDNQSARGLSF